LFLLFPHVRSPSCQLLCFPFPFSFSFYFLIVSACLLLALRLPGASLPLLLGCCGAGEEEHGTVWHPLGRFSCSFSPAYPEPRFESSIFGVV